MKLKEASLPSLAVLTILYVLYLFIDFIDATGFAFFIYGVSMIHITWSIANKRCRSVPVRYSVHICNLAMLTISCFTLNESVEIFAKFTPWVYLILLLTFITLLLDVFVEIPFKLWKFVYGLMVTLGLFVAVYFNILLLPMFLVGIIGIIVLGLGIHLFVPAILAITIIVHLYKKWQHHYLMAGVITGVLIAAGSMIMFFTNINKAHEILEDENVSYVTSEQKYLPKWVYIAQKLPKNKWTEMMLLSDFKYELFDNWFMGRNINTGNSLGEKGLHEPFLNLAKLTGLHKMSLSDADRLMILKTNFNSRHETSRKLWSGEHLITSQCVTDVKLYPDYRLAYTQKTFFIKNISTNEWQREEALYTLHLPKDAVVSSMSLWVNGVERKSRLTTKEKADSAYVQIVGVQNRDPALLHWQEGNRVNVTVFPCTVQEVRMLKVGYTTPLKSTDNELEYQDIYVEGPSFSQCRNDVQITGHSDNAKVKGNQITFKKSGGTLVSNFKNNKTWNISIPKVPLGTKCFAFNNKYFRVSEETETIKNIAYDHIILDVNANWTKSDFDKIIKNNKLKKIWYASDENTLSVVEDNAESVWDAMHEKNFQMIPFHKIDPAKSILITKPVPNAPSYTDLNSSAYARKLSQSVLKSTQPLTCLALHSGESDYLFTTLHNMNYLNLHDVSIDQCLQILSTEALTERITDSRSVNIDNADINIAMVDADSNTGAPDHLMRLYDYKKILQQSGKFFFDKSNSDSLKSSVDMANEAFIVTPVSSLIVLETDKDYDDMGIDENKNSLLNATKKGKGAVPEPHEWVMIILGIGALLFFMGKQTKLI